MKKHDRAEDQTVLGISMPKELKAKIAAAAAADNRSMANWCVHHLHEILGHLETAASEPPSSKPLESVDDPHPQTKHGTG